MLAYILAVIFLRYKRIDSMKSGRENIRSCTYFILKRKKD